MEAEFWHEAWQVGKTGFHMNSFNSTLLKYFPTFNVKNNACVLVPLCGKTLDLIWLSKQGHQVIGIELSELAVTDFFKENNLDFSLKTSEHFKIYISDNITIYCGNFFDLNKEMIPNVAAVYDRAAIVALPDNMRKRYLDHMASLIDADTDVLLLSFERKPHTNHGPPHSIPKEEMTNNTSEFFNSKVLEESKEKIRSKLLQEEGINHMQRIVYHLIKK